jgi:hypothetical protein
MGKGSGDCERPGFSLEVEDSAPSTVSNNDLESNGGAFGYQPLSAQEWDALSRGESLEEKEAVAPPPPPDLPEGNIHLWLDDIRPVPDGWYWAKDAPTAIAVLSTGRVIEASLDHDLGEEVPSGYDVVMWMRMNNCWPQKALAVHSDNSSGSSGMLQMIEASNTYKGRLGRKFQN